MDGRKISTMLAWGVALVMVGAGIAVLAGFFLSNLPPGPLRMTVGIVFLLLGIYRFLMTRMQARQAERLDE